MMPIGLDEIATATFRPTAQADDLAKRLKDRLGFGAFYIPARLAIARSLAVDSSPALISGEVGRTIKGELLFGIGADLATWVSLIVEHGGREPETLKELQAVVAAHWTRGLTLLVQALDEAGEPSSFWQSMAQAALPAGDATDGGGPVADDAVPPGELAVPIGPVGEDVATSEAVKWRLNAPGGSPHAGIMGGVGSGKTRTAIFMLREVRRQVAVPLIAFDFKGDMNDDTNGLDQAFQATVLSPPHQRVPLDILAFADRSSTGVALAAQRLRDTLATLKGAGFGAQQKDALAEASERALRSHATCRIEDIRDALKSVYANRGRKEDGAVMTLNDLCRLPLFTPELEPKAFFSRSWIIRLTQELPDLVRVSIVTLITDALDRYLNSLPEAAADANGNRALRVLCVIDEAHRILGSRLPGLSGLIRLSRSKGGAIMLISQSPEDFAGEDDDFLSEMGLVMAFGTNANPRAVHRILGANANLTVLQKGQAWAKLRGEASARRALVWD